MSGTSADGIDVAICEVLPSASAEWGKLLHHSATAYSQSVRERIHELRRLGACTLAELGQLTRDLTLEHAGAVRRALSEAGIEAAALTAVADHGQTLYHAPPVTMQVLDPALLAWEVGTAVISDFRRADCAAGGQGAPLVPYADLRLFASPDRRRALLNLGGIGNITILPGEGLAEAIAFDTGPANCLSDYLCRAADPTGPGHDEGGERARRGRAAERVVSKFLEYGYFRRRPPKSTDGPEMIQAFRTAGGMGLELEDGLATAAECVARSIVEALAPFEVEEVIASGGGTYNRALMTALTRALGEIELRSTDELGVPSQAKEAIAFALLGAACLDGVPGNLPSVTGAARPLVLGSITPAP